MVDHIRSFYRPGTVTTAVSAGSSFKLVVRGEFRHSNIYNVLLLVVLGAVVLISLNNVDKALRSAFGLNHSGHITVVFMLASAVVIAVTVMVYRQRMENK